ncbi:GIY-YIG nuclease family protein [Azospirillum palustre]
MFLNDLLTAGGVDSKQTLVLRHRPTEPTLARVLPWLAAERTDLFDSYQSCQGERLEAAMSKLPYVASFIAHGPGRALFVGLYSINEPTPYPRADFWSIPGYAELRGFGMDGLAPTDPRQSILKFDLRLLDFRQEWRGKLIVGWPPPERSWWRRAHQNKMPVLAILEDSALEPAMPDWTELLVAWAELSVLPRRWCAALSEWRGIYYIRDTSDGRGYVGSAAGAENLLGRWRNYAKTGHGGNRLLLDRNPDTFVFSILQRTSPDMPKDDIARLETSWKVRLGTHAPAGLNDN